MGIVRMIYVGTVFSVHIFRARFKTGQYGQGPPRMSCQFLLFWYSRVGWASTAPLLKAAQGPPHF